MFKEGSPSTPENDGQLNALFLFEQKARRTEVYELMSDTLSVGKVKVYERKEAELEFPGIVNFDMIENQAAGLVSAALNTEVDFQDPAGLHITAAITRERKVGNSNFTWTDAHNLADMFEFNHYREKMATQRSTTRDVQYTVFDAKNNKFVGARFENPDRNFFIPLPAKVVVSLGENTPWSDEVSEWVLKNHEKETQLFERQVAPRAISKVLNQLITPVK